MIQGQKFNNSPILNQLNLSGQLHKELVVAFLLRLELEFSVGGFHCDHLTSLEAIAIARVALSFFYREW